MHRPDLSTRGPKAAWSLLNTRARLESVVKIVSLLELASRLPDVNRILLRAIPIIDRQSHGLQ